MAEVINQIDEFKKMLEENKRTYLDFGNGLLIVFNDELVNIRQYHDDFCLSGWVKKEEFQEKIKGLI